MKIRALLAAILMAIPAISQAQDTTAIKQALAHQKQFARDTIDKDKSRPAYVKRAQDSILLDQTRILSAMRKKVDTIIPVPPVPSAARVEIHSTASSVPVGGTLQLIATVRDSASNILPNATVSWSVTEKNYADISGAGLLTGKGAGLANVTATSGRASQTRGYTVTGVAPPDTTKPPIPPDTTKPPVPPDTTTPPSGGFDGVAALPQETPTIVNPSCSTSIPLTQGMDLQQAINMAQPGACLLLAPGTTFTGNFTLPDKGGQSWIQIVTQAQLPTAGTRITPSVVATLRLAKILSPNYNAALTFAQGANHYRFRGVEISGTSATMNMIVDIRNNASTFSPTTAPRYLQFEQVYIHGTATMDVRRCLWTDGYMESFFDSWIADCHSNNSDSQSGLHLSGARGVLWQNNHLEAGHEIFMSGGGDTPDSTMTPRDITFRRNHVIRPLAWKGVWQAKNIFELKHIRRLLVEGNVFENVWPDAQMGFGFVLKSENQTGNSPWTTASDVTIRYNRAMRMASGFNISALGSNGTPGIPACRYSIHDNFADSVNYFKDGSNGVAIQNLGNTCDIQYRHNTILNGVQGFPSNQAISFDGLPAVRAVWDGNTIGHGSYGVKGAGTADGIPTLTKFAPGSIFTNNAIVGGCGTYPATNSCLSTAPPSSVTTGADMQKLNALIAGVVVNDALSTKRAVARPNQLKYRIKAVPDRCKKDPKADCAPPMNLK